MSADFWLEAVLQRPSSRLIPFVVLLTCCGASVCLGQMRGTNVAVIGTAQASEVVDGLGFNLDPEQDWEWAAASAAGAKYARFQCSWQTLEQQTPAPDNKAARPQYVEDPKCLAGFASAVRYGMRATVVAAFGPPHHKILTVSLVSGAETGSASLDVLLEAGAGGDGLNSIKFPYDYICQARVDETGAISDDCGSQFTGHHSYQGALITGIKMADARHATVLLASAVARPLAASRAVLRGCNLQANTNVLTCSQSSVEPSAVTGAQVTIQVQSRTIVGLAKSVVRSGDQVVVTLGRPFPYNLSNVGVTTLTPYLVSEILYPSTETDKPDDPSVVAYSNYVSFLAEDMAAHGVKGDIEIWNEPPWANDPWDYRKGLYDASLYSGPDQYGANFGFAANIMHRRFPTGVTATWNGTSGNGFASLLGTKMLQYSGERFVQPSVITRESIHPYNGAFSNPEATMFVQSCLSGTALARPGTAAASPFANGASCYLPGMEQTANYMEALRLDLQAKSNAPESGIGHSITETNELPPAAGMKMKQALAVLRQFIGFEADGISPVEFFKLWNRGQTDPSFGFVSKTGAGSQFLPTPAYTALQGFEADIRPISKAPLPQANETSLPSVASYSGSYPLAVAHVVGARAGAKSNSDDFVLWQLSSCQSGKDCWFLLSSPPPAQVTVRLAPRTKVTSVTNLLTRAPIQYLATDGQVTVPVSDSPVGILVDPQ